MRARRSLLVVLCVALVLLATPATAPAGGAGDWQLVWSDSFEGTSLDATKWVSEWSTYGDGNNELQCYRPESVVVTHGSMYLVAYPWEARCPWGASRDFSSGMVRTRGLFDWTYGRFEIDAVVPSGEGLWPGAWLSPIDQAYGPWPHSGELDILEIRGREPDRVVGSAHWAGADGRHRLDNADFRLTEGSFADGPHTFAIEWTPYSIVWSVDGQPYNWLIFKDLVTSAGSGGAPFDQPFYLKLNLTVGGDWVGPPNASTPWPADFRIDEVRVYQR